MTVEFEGFQASSSAEFDPVAVDTMYFRMTASADHDDVVFFIRAAIAEINNVVPNQFSFIQALPH